MNVGTASFGTFNGSQGIETASLQANDESTEAGSEQDQSSAELAEIAEMAAMKRAEAEALIAQGRALNGGFSFVA